MKRFAMDWLEQWKKKPYRKPVIIEGASGVGKTWLMKKFGENAYRDSVYIDFNLEDYRIKRLFTENLDIGFLVSGLEVCTGKKINPSETLIILDNVQKLPEALLSLRRFYEDIQDYHLMSASSQLNITACDGFSSLAGRVEILKLYPMSFQEFFAATESEDKLINYLSKNQFVMTDTFKQNYLDALKKYCFVGGMPEAVGQFAKNRDFDEVREIHKHILSTYENVFLNDAPTAASRSKICEIWKSIPSQLNKENKKFFYEALQDGGRAKFYEEAIAWLSGRGFVYRVDRITSPEILLENHENSKTFKLFTADIGLLGYMMGLHVRMIFDGNVLFDKYHRAFTEQYVLQQLVTIPGWNIHYYANERSACEISFLMDNGRLVIPVDVVTKRNLKAKRLQTYRERFHPVKSVQVSTADYSMEERFMSLPLYAVEKIIMMSGL